MALGIVVVHCGVFALSSLGAQRIGDGIDEPTGVAAVIALGVIVIPILVLIWGAILASRQIRRKTGWLTTPEGLILTLISACVGAFVVSLPFTIPATVFMVVSLPIVTWVYLAALPRRLASSPATKDHEPQIQSA